MNAPLHAPQVLFEMLQSDLDGATEKLSHMLENERGADRAPLVDCTSHAKKRLANFREGVEQGVLSQTNVELMAAQAAEAARVAKGSQGRAESAAAFPPPSRRGYYSMNNVNMTATNMGGMSMSNMGNNMGGFSNTSMGMAPSPVPSPNAMPMFPTNSQPLMQQSSWPPMGNPMSMQSNMQ